MTRRNLELNEISTLDFTALCTQLADAYANDRSSVDGAVLAELAKRLIAAETQPGGPYTNEAGLITIQLNAAIGRLFLLMGHPLPNIDTYLSEASPKLSAIDHAALKHYQAARENTSSRKTQQTKQHISYRRATKTLATLDEPIKTQALQFLARIEAADTTHEIAAISEFTQRALGDTSIPLAKLHALGEANVYSWIAYSIYDHILDKEADASLLPAANVCMRLALECYKQTLPVRHSLQALIARYFDQVDTTSAWEVTSCRFAITDDTIKIGALPDYEQYEPLAWRSCIHILGPQIVASFAPSTPSKNAEHLAVGLQHYLIARQLGDDIHDWREDLLAGRISAVVALLLFRQGVREGSIHNLTALVATIQEDFLRTGAVEVSNLILQHTERALSELGAAGCDSASELIDLVQRLARMAREAAHHQQRFVSFQHTYSDTINKELAP